MAAHQPKVVKVVEVGYALDVTAHKWPVVRQFIGYSVVLAFMTAALRATQSHSKCLYVIASLLTLFILEPIPYQVSSMLPLFLFPVVQLLKAKKLTGIYMNDDILKSISSILVALIVMRSPLSRRAALWLLSWTGMKVKRVLVTIMGIVFMVSMLVQSTMTTGILAGFMDALIFEIYANNLRLRYALYRRQEGLSPRPNIDFMFKEPYEEEETSATDDTTVVRGAPPEDQFPPRPKEPAARFKEKVVFLDKEDRSGTRTVIAAEYSDAPEARKTRVMEKLQSLGINLDSMRLRLTVRGEENAIREAEQKVPGAEDRKEDGERGGGKDHSKEKSRPSSSEQDEIESGSKDKDQEGRDARKGEMNVAGREKNKGEIQAREGRSHSESKGKELKGKDESGTKDEEGKNENKGREGSAKRTLANSGVRTCAITKNDKRATLPSGRKPDEDGKDSNEQHIDYEHIVLAELEGNEKEATSQIPTAYREKQTTGPVVAFCGVKDIVKPRETGVERSTSTRSAKRSTSDSFLIWEDSAKPTATSTYKRHSVSLFSAMAWRRICPEDISSGPAPQSVDLALPGDDCPVFHFGDPARDGHAQATASEGQCCARSKPRHQNRTSHSRQGKVVRRERRLTRYCYTPTREDPYATTTPSTSLSPPATSAASHNGQYPRHVYNEPLAACMWVRRKRYDASSAYNPLLATDVTFHMNRLKRKVSSWLRRASGAGDILTSLLSSSNVTSVARRGEEVMCYEVLVPGAGLDEDGSGSKKLQSWLHTTQLSPGTLDAVIFEEKEKAKDLRSALLLALAYASSFGATTSYGSSGANLYLKRYIKSHYSTLSLTYFHWWILHFPFCLFVMYMSSFVLRFLLVWKYDNDDTDIYPPSRTVIRDRLHMMGEPSYNEYMVGFLCVFALLLLVFRDPVFMRGWAVRLGIEREVTDASVGIVVGLLAFLFPTEILPQGQRDPLLQWDDLHKRLPWGVIFVLGGAATISEAIEENGVYDLLEHFLMNITLPEMYLQYLVVIIIGCLGEITTKSSRLKYFTAIGAKLAEKFKREPLFFLLPINVICQFSLILPSSAPENAMAFEMSSMTSLQMIVPGIIIKVLTVVLYMTVVNLVTFITFRQDLNTSIALPQADSSVGPDNVTGPTFLPMDYRCTPGNTSEHARMF